MFSYKPNAICMAGMTMPVGAGHAASHCWNRVRKPRQLINYARFWPQWWTFAKNRTAHVQTHYRKSTQWQWASFVSGGERGPNSITAIKTSQHFFQWLGIPLALSKTHILFDTDLRICNSAINLIVLLTKFYIYKRRCQGSSLSFFLQREIESYYKLDKYVLLNKFKLFKFQKPMAGVERAFWLTVFWSKRYQINIFN